MDVSLRGLKKSNKSRFDSYSVKNKCIDHIPYYLCVACTVFATTFLEIAVYISYIHTFLILKTWSRGTNSRFAIVPLT